MLFFVVNFNLVFCIGNCSIYKKFRTMNNKLRIEYNKFDKLSIVNNKFDNKYSPVNNKIISNKL